jgi:hypothetical protein
MEAWDAWSAAARCSAIFGCSPRAGEAMIRIEYEPFLAPSRPALEVTCLVNGEAAASWIDDAAASWIDDAAAGGRRPRLVKLGVFGADAVVAVM